MHVLCRWYSYTQRVEVGIKYDLRDLEIILRNVYLPSEYNQDGIHGIYV